MYSILIILSLFLQVFAAPFNSTKSDKCGYDACTSVSSDDLNVHIVAHSHDDVGWLKTVDQYYYGSRSGIQFAGVQYIIDSVIRALLKNPERKFIQVESAFLYQWWQEQDEKKREDVKKLINNGQLEIVGGAWSMNDESAAHYQSIIDQFTYGLQFLKDTFGKCALPKIGWQIDPFGHTREMASIFSQMGFDALFFSRLDWKDKSERLETNTAEMLWRGSENLEYKATIFTHALYNHYSPPKGFYFDVLSNDDPLIDDKRSSEYNLETRMLEFTKFVSKQAKYYTTNNIIITMGNDFTYQDAHYSFTNLDILIKAYNDFEHTDSDGKRIKLLYSTPSCYIKAVNDAAEKNTIKYKIKTDDFIPYASDPHTYWSGYYTSRPTQKRFERQGNNLLQISKQLAVFSELTDPGLIKNLNSFKAAMGVMQHHDAITGTEKQHVAQDYARILMKSITANDKNLALIIPYVIMIINDAAIHVKYNVLANYFSKKDGKTNLQFNSCLLANVSHCEESQKKEFVVAVYNPLSREVSDHIRLPVNTDKFSITDGQGNNVKYQLTPSIDTFEHVENIVPSKFDLVFLAEKLPPLGLKLFYVVNNNFGKPPADIKPIETMDRYDLGDQKIGITLNPLTGLMVQAHMNGLEISIKQQLMYYFGAEGDNMEFKNRSSGAYIFRPDPKKPDANEFNSNIISNIKVYKGDIVDEVHQTFGDWAKQIIRVYKNAANYFEFDWLVGPIDTSNKEGKEVISRFESNLLSDKFYTDSNGREIITRRNDFRATYNYSNEEPISGNYYPITSGISLVDEYRNIEIAVLNDRAQGGASLNSGHLELMVHRRLLKDDAFGVEEALDETEFNRGLVVRGQHYLTIGSTKKTIKTDYSRKIQRDVASRKLSSPWVFLADADKSPLEELKKNIEFEFSGITRNLPDEVKILTLEPWGSNTVLLRFEHILEIAEGGKQVTIDLQGLFKQFEITGYEETTLSADRLLNENKRLFWNEGDCLDGTTECSFRNISNERIEVQDELQIILSPMDIRTFIATIKFN